MDVVDEAKGVAATHEWHIRLDEAIEAAQKRSANMVQEATPETEAIAAGEIEGARVAAFIRAIKVELDCDAAAVAQVAAVYVALLAQK